MKSSVSYRRNGDKEGTESPRASAGGVASLLRDGDLLHFLGDSTILNVNTLRIISEKEKTMTLNENICSNMQVFKN